MVSRLAADLVLLLHGLFVLTVVVGALLVLRWPRFAWVQLPAAAWGAFVELTGRICPLTTLENTLRRSAGEAGYSTSFVEQYVVPLIYPPGLDRELQTWLGVLVIAINAILYGLVVVRAARRRSAMNEDG